MVLSVIYQEIYNLSLILLLNSYLSFLLVNFLKFSDVISLRAYIGIYYIYILIINL